MPTGVRTLCSCTIDENKSLDDTVKGNPSHRVPVTEYADVIECYFGVRRGGIFFASGEDRF